MIDPFGYRQGRLHAEDVPLEQIAAEFGTPCYVYSRAAIEQNYLAFEQPLQGQPHLLCYAVKANSNLAVLNLLARLGAGFDIVSVGELERVLAAGGDPARVIFSGVGKRADEMARALDVGVRCFNVESIPELDRLEAVARAHGQRAPISIRVNPDVDARTHAYIATGRKENKFGIEFADALALYGRAAASPHLEVVGVDCHIGSQLTEIEPFLVALERMLELLDQLRAQGIEIRHLDLGGGLGVRYRDETPPTPAQYITALSRRLAGTGLELVLEPGRAIVANAGLLLSRVEYLKQSSVKRFAIIDAAMNDLLRPTLYNAWQAVCEVTRRGGEPVEYEVVGPVCESGDFLAKARLLDIEAGDLLAIRSAGAYGFVMASNYNSRGRPAEVMVSGTQMHLVRPRETLASLYADERLLP